MKVSVVIPAKNEEKYLPGCLKSLKEQNFPQDDFEIIVVDPQSEDRTAEIAKKFGAKVVTTNAKNVAQARQDGCKTAKGEFLLGSDADVRFPKDWISRIVEHLSKPSVVCTCGPFLFYEKAPLWAKIAMSGASFYGVGFFHKVFGRTLMSGQNYGVRKDAFWKVGGFGEKMAAYEDVDLVARLKKVGKVVWDPTLVVKGSSRRSKEGFFHLVKRFLTDYKNYFILGKREGGDFPEIR